VHPHMLRHACGYALAKGARHQGAASLFGTQKHPAYGALHRAIAVAVQGFLAVLSYSALAKRVGTAHSFFALKEAIVQINMNAELLGLIGQLRNKLVSSLPKSADCS
jgi:hypothetical protein